MNPWPWLILTTLYGGCVGSFINVVAYRLPEGLSLVRPASRCPKCSHALAWYDNVPVLGWIWLRGRCRYCKAAISPQYPIVEAACALLFGGIFAAYYMTDLRPDFIFVGGLEATWPVLLVHLSLVGSLLAATLIDARLYIIPLPIPWFATLVALIVLPVSAVFRPEVAWVGPSVGDRWLTGMAGAAAGGAAGLILALTLLRLGVLPRSFADEEQDDDALGGTHAERDRPIPSDPKEVDAWLGHPHLRREILKELAFVMLPLAGCVGGWWAFVGLGVDLSNLEAPWRVLVGVVCGYLIGGGLIWLTRIFGSLAFGKEAMGLGDVPLLAAIGAALGPAEAMLVFLVAPLLGLSVAALSLVLGSKAKEHLRVMPYGPSLAAAAVAVMVFHDRLLALAQEIFGIV